MVSYSFDLEITPGSMPPILHMAQYDSGRTYTANLKNNGVAFSPTQGSTAKIKGRNPGGVCWEQEATVSGSTVTFTPEGAATDQFGIMPVQLEITKEDTISTLIIIFDIQRAGYTNEEAASSPEFQTALEAAVAAAIEEGGIGFSEAFKQALMTCMAHVAWSDEHGQDYYDALEDALYPAPGPATLVSITADYEQDRPIYPSDDLDVLKVSDDLTVTANYSDGTSVVLGDDDYTLSGTLTAGTSTITVTYQGKTATVDVAVTNGTDVTPSLSTFVSGNATYCEAIYNSTYDTLRIKTKSNRAYQNASVPFTMQPSKVYFVSYDLAVTSGHSLCGFRNSSNTLISDSPIVTANAHVDHEASYDSTAVNFAIFCTFSTAEAGDITVSNFKIYERDARG